MTRAHYVEMLFGATDPDRPLNTGSKAEGRNAFFPIKGENTCLPEVRKTSPLKKMLALKQKQMM